MATMITESQQRKKPDMNVPLTGFFYTGPSKKFILHYCHNGREQEPIAALTLLCEAFPENTDYMNWYSAVVLHSEFLKTIAVSQNPTALYLHQYTGTMIICRFLRTEENNSGSRC